MPKKKSRKGPKMVRASVSFTAKDYTELEKIAVEKRVSVAWVVRHAVDQYLAEKYPLFHGIVEPRKEGT